MNQHEWEFFAVLTPIAVHLVNAAAVVGVELAESAGAPLAPFDEDLPEQATA